MSARASGVRWSRTRRSRAGLLLAVAAVTGCGTAPEPGAAAGGDSPSPSAQESPAVWEGLGGSPLPSPEAPSKAHEGSAAPDDSGAPPEAEPAAIPDRCGDAGVDGAAEDAFTGLIEGDAQFTEVRSETALECSWAGFGADGSEVVMVSFSSESSLVSSAGAVPEAAEGDPAFFTTPAVAELGGVGQWVPAEMFSRVRLHFPGLLVTVSANSARMEQAGPEVVEAAVSAAETVLGEGSVPADGDSADGDSDSDD
ncbi:hypothetical protein [Nocardiopsis coralliicola]